MIIIVEGPDGGGKSYLAQLISDETGFPVLHSGGFKEDIRVRTERYLSMSNTTFDRFPIISENVYGPILRGKSLLPWEEYFPRLQQVDYLLVYCRTDIWTLEKTKQEAKKHKPQSFIDRIMKELLAITKRYDELMEYLKPIRFDRREQSCAELIWQLEKKMSTR